MQDAGQEPRSVRSAQLAMLQAATYHRPCPSVPMPFRFSQDKLDAVVDDDWLVLEKPVRKSMEFLLRERGELGVVDGKSWHERSIWKDAVNVGLWPQFCLRPNDGRG